MMTLVDKSIPESPQSIRLEGLCRTFCISSNVKCFLAPLIGDALKQIRICITMKLIDNSTFIAQMKPFIPHILNFGFDKVVPNANITAVSLARVLTEHEPTFTPLLLHSPYAYHFCNMIAPSQHHIETLLRSLENYIQQQGKAHPPQLIRALWNDQIEAGLDDIIFQVTKPTHLWGPVPGYIRQAGANCSERSFSFKF
ncbi:hypothetical protein BLNAU_787 [Blattamonas nauphoetae]|uniref:Uncharacterized protein n=1 Tax=Blattamonas nauphoetae TaxID=2049346 RepID=A0ABQ9YKH7_9EUKA|nr:hypothetical protein BLNAU_787 [Blattamonas nauphoetae]